ncbi:hypothetical protein Tco_1006085 [Tanacetum coccineum]|uniref:Uncharacterized protein n=1 Tax=Tanacetum coccineum TaxID=301880 RepID=A0ABQ5FGZ7_9ASTR
MRTLTLNPIQHDPFLGCCEVEMVVRWLWLWHGGDDVVEVVVRFRRCPPWWPTAGGRRLARGDAGKHGGEEGGSVCGG